MPTKSILKIWLLPVNFEKFTSINLWTDKSQHFKRSTVIGPSREIHLYKLIEGTNTALQTLDCEWSVHKFIEVNFSKLTDNNQIFRNVFDCIHYHICKIFQIIQCKIFASYDFLEMNSCGLWLRNSSWLRSVGCRPNPCTYMMEHLTSWWLMFLTEYGFLL